MKRGTSFSFKSFPSSRLEAQWWWQPDADSCSSSWVPAHSCGGILWSLLPPTSHPSSIPKCQMADFPRCRSHSSIHALTHLRPRSNPFNKSLLYKSPSGSASLTNTHYKNRSRKIIRWRKESSRILIRGIMIGRNFCSAIWGTLTGKQE